MQNVYLIDAYTCVFHSYLIWQSLTFSGNYICRTQLSDFTFTFHFHELEKEMASHSNVRPRDGGAWWAAVSGVTQSQTRLIDFTFTFHFHELEEEMATHSSVLAWRIPGTAKPGGLPSMGSHRVRHDWSGLAAAAAEIVILSEVSQTQKDKYHDITYM